MPVPYPLPSPPPRFGGGIPWKQYQLIQRDGVHMSHYAARTFGGVALHSHLRTSNYFYYNCLTGEWAGWGDWWGAGRGAGVPIPEAPGRPRRRAGMRLSDCQPRPCPLPRPSSRPCYPTGKFARDNCPAYLTPEGFCRLKDEGQLDALTIVNGFFLPTVSGAAPTALARGRSQRGGHRPACKSPGLHGSPPFPAPDPCPASPLCSCAPACTAA